MSETDLGQLAERLSGLQVSSPEHPEDRRRRHRKENVALFLIVGSAAVGALILLLSVYRPVPQRQTDWAVGIVQAVIGGAVGYALK